MATGHISTIVHDSPRYIAPMPSAPSLPDDASWLRGNSLVAGHEADGILGAAPVSRPAVGSGFVNGYPPVLGMSSLYHYRNSQNVACSPIPMSGGPAFGNEVSSFELCDQWGNWLVSNPMVYWGPEYYVGGGEDTRGPSHMCVVWEWRSPINSRHFFTISRRKKGSCSRPRSLS